jgi:hypothetical protein
VHGDTCTNCKFTVCEDEAKGFGKQSPYTWCLECKRAKTRRQRSSKRGYIRYLYNQMRARARTKGRDCTVTEQDLHDLWTAQNGCCALTGVPMTHTYSPDMVAVSRITNGSVDRVDSAVGYVPGNVQFVCVRVNLMKGPMREEQLFALCSAILEHNNSRVTTHNRESETNHSELHAKREF